MIPAIHQPAPFYRTEEIASKAAWLDIGKPKEVFERAGFSGRGKNQKAFLHLAASADLICIRVGMNCLAVKLEDLKELVSSLS